MLTADFQSPPALGAGMPFRQACTVNGEVVWRWIALAFAAYWIVFVAGAYGNRPELNNLGAVFILATLAWATIERLGVKVDAVAIAAVLVNQWADVVLSGAISVGQLSSNLEALAVHLSVGELEALATLSERSTRYWSVRQSIPWS